MSMSEFDLPWDDIGIHEEYDEWLEQFVTDTGEKSMTNNEKFKGIMCQLSLSSSHKASLARIFTKFENKKLSDEMAELTKFDDGFDAYMTKHPHSIQNNKLRY